MTYRIQVYYPDAGGFMNTNHESADLESLKALAGGESFHGSKLRIVDWDGTVVFEPGIQQPVRERDISDIATMLGVPVFGSAEDFLKGMDGDDPKDR